MKKGSVLLLAMIFVCSILLNACSSGSNTGNEPVNKPADTPANTPSDEVKPAEGTGETVEVKDPKDYSGTISLMTPWGEFNPKIIEAFNKKYPNIKVESAGGGDNWADKLMTSLSTGTGAPDVVQVHEVFYDRFKAIDGLEDLLLPPYDAGKYKKDFTDNVWSLSTSLDNKRLFGFPYYLNPYVTFYRADVMEENGYPSDPQELGEYIADPDQFFTMAKTLASKGYVFFRWPGEITDISHNGTGFYDHNLNYLRNTEEFVKAIDYAKRSLQLGLLTNEDIRGEKADQVVKNGKLAMYHNPPSAINFLQGRDTTNKWRVTTLPFGNHPARGMSTFLIPSQSKNKELSWEFIKFVTMDQTALEIYMELGDSVPAYLPAREFPIVKTLENEYLGGQKALEFYFSQVDLIKNPIGSPLDFDANIVWREALSEALTKNKDSQTALNEIMDAIEKKVSVQKHDLMKQLGQ